jgi:predicted RNase H-like nuclease
VNRDAPDPTRRVLGVDGCPSGWVAVELQDGEVAHVEVAGSLAALVARIRRHGPVAVDIPIGLLNVDRDADAAARKLLPGRASSVFSAPPLAVVEAWRAGRLGSHAEASALARATTGKGLSQQAWRLVPKVAEAEDLVASGEPLLEVHPEVAFALVAGGPLPSKRSWAGVSARSGVLAALGLDLPPRFDGDRRAAPDDVLDAAICAWVADGWAAGTPIRRLPSATTQRAHGRPVVIHAREEGGTGE